MMASPSHIVITRAREVRLHAVCYLPEANVLGAPPWFLQGVLGLDGGVGTGGVEADSAGGGGGW